MPDTKRSGILAAGGASRAQSHTMSIVIIVKGTPFPSFHLHSWVNEWVSGKVRLKGEASESSREKALKCIICVSGERRSPAQLLQYF
ncbi:hypothetical protein ElyMa_006800200 [Elysia marginata]|uniref:Uncharacterized protein n=1 Tax=Elysia marginata TaxID=1093978 RepID=A0AAV4J6J7_9GAST|nr:hypothetical protein ElyMa_006800200 [Elysia marginata]